MAAETEFAIGARASCTNGSCGHIRRIIVDPATDTVTHLVIQPGHRQDAGRLVPAHLVEAAAGEIRLRCTLADFYGLDHAEEHELVDEGDEHVGSGGHFGGLVYGASGEAYAPAGAGELLDIGHLPEHRIRTIIEDVVPLGEDQVRPGDRVHATDGEIGQVQGCLVNPDDDRVTHVLLQEGHLSGRREIAIPVSAVNGFDAGVRLNITKEQVRNLPPGG